jgi:site-specific recombinase XerD
MFNDTLIPKDPNGLELMIDRDRYYRLRSFVQWLDETNRHWNLLFHRDLEAYIAYLEQEKGLAPRSVYAHISTIRGRYQELVSESQNSQQDQGKPLQLFGKTLKPLAPKTPGPGLTYESITEQAKRRDAWLAGITTETFKGLTGVRNTQAPSVNAPAVYWDLLASRVFSQIRQQAEPERIRLTGEQANELLNSPDTDTLIGTRDKALIALMLCTGIREAEAHALDVPDVHDGIGDGIPALHIPEKPGCTERLIPYGNMLAARDLVEDWLKAARFSNGPLFRGIYKGGSRIRPGRIGLRSIAMILSNYPVETDGEPLKVTSLMLRRTYARRLHEEGVRVSTIQQYLGLGSSDTTLDYIGLTEDDPQDFGPPSLYSGL